MLALFIFLSYFRKLPKCHVLVFIFTNDKCINILNQSYEQYHRYPITLKTTIIVPYKASSKREVAIAIASFVYN